MFYSKVPSLRHFPSKTYKSAEVFILELTSPRRFALTTALSLEYRPFYPIFPTYIIKDKDLGGNIIKI